jgi:hypothetical protein
LVLLIQWMVLVTVGSLCFCSWEVA